MKEQIIEYIKTLRDEREFLLSKIKEIESELKELETISTVVKGPATRSAPSCELCHGTGEYWDNWAGNIPCPKCNNHYGY